jgi:prepilin-type N-terminal cleavage/methylation domain-containing protein
MELDMMHDKRLDCLTQRGFTLIEQMVVVCVLALLMTLSVPSFQQIVASVRLQYATGQLIVFLKQARSEAITRSANVYVCPINVRVNFDIQGCAVAATPNQEAWSQGFMAYADRPQGKPASYDSKESTASIIFKHREAKINQATATQAASLIAVNIQGTRQFYFMPNGAVNGMLHANIHLLHTRTDLCYVLGIRGYGSVEIDCKGSYQLCGCTPYV